MLQGGQILAARYVLLRKLGEGRATQVWQARDRESGTDRVLKILVSADSGERDRFLAGVRLQQRLAHPNLQACAAVSDGEPPFAVFDGVAPGDLTALRDRPWPQLLGVLAGIADGLAELHARGLVHRDLKPANVLLGEDGVPVLGDFGLAAAAGDAAAPRGGSPFAMSPQQLDGLPPAPADDLYAFGALAYELLGGYPPFYPDARHERIRTESPAPLPTRASVPAGLEQLVLRCLAKDPRDRPDDAVQLAASLRALGAAAADASRPVAAAAVQLRPPPPAEPGIDPAWNRAVPAGPSPEQLRSQGFRRGLVAASLGFLLLVAGFVFFVLPQRVERAAQSTPTATTPAMPAQPAASSPATPDLQKLADAKRAFEELRPLVGQRLDVLERRAAGQWGGEVFARGKRALAKADAAFGSREHLVALATLRAAAEDFAATEREAAAQLGAALAAGSAAIDRGDAAAARSAFERALAIEPGNAVARRGLERAGTLTEVRQLLAEAAQLEQQGQTAAATAAYRKTLHLDRDTQAARQALARLDAQATGGAFAAAMSQGLASLARRDFAAARAAFEHAGRLRPDAPEVAEGLAQVERGLADRSIGAHLEAAQQAERAERWAEALAEYRKALDVDRNLLVARQGVERAEPRAMLDAELAAVIERPERLFSLEIRGAARATLQQARAVPAPGPVLARQIETVERLVASAETPLRVALASDNLTEVTINRIGRLGAFDRKDVELLPGRYTVVGVRAGFRDVRRELTLVPGREAPTLVIRCEEPI
jgi:tetratricopeptide (TPR) repeat protein